MQRAKSIFLPHGGGPMPILKDPGHNELTSFLQAKCKEWLGKPKAIILVTAHWETNQVNISASENTFLYYDYYNFPKEAYDIKFPAKGAPEIAQLIKQQLEQEGVKCILDNKRGLDHGVFIPMLLLTPECDIPIIQVSICALEDHKIIHNFPLSSFDQTNG